MSAPLEIYKEEVWEILDPNTAQLVAIFYDHIAAFQYLAWRNQTSSASQSPCADAKQEPPAEEQTSATKVPPAAANTRPVAEPTSPQSKVRPEGQIDFRGEPT